MKKDWKYLLYLSLAFGLFVLVQLSGPKQFDWTPTYGYRDRNPFGAYVLKELLPSGFAPKQVRISHKTIYELKDSLQASQNMLIICNDFSGDGPDTDVMLAAAESGAHFFISAQDFRGKFADTLKLELRDNYFQSITQDSAWLYFRNPVNDAARYLYRRDNIHSYFSRFDSSRTTIIAENMLDQPVTVRIRYGKGSFILNSTPLAFTNIYLLNSNHSDFAARSLSCLPKQALIWSSFYNLGRGESLTPLRYILTQEPLAWAYYLSVVSLVLFMIFESRRRQRIIPILEPLQNTSLEFAGTIGNLYYARGDHRNLAEKKILFLMEHIRTRFGLRVTTGDEQFVKILSRKSGHEESFIRTLLDQIEQIRSKKTISGEELIRLNATFESFNKAK